MPTVLKCSKCNHVLDEWRDLPSPALGHELWYHHLYTNLDGKCPKCGHILPPPTEFLDKAKFEVKPYQ